MRNTYQPTPGEFLVGNKLEELGYAVYLPTKDKGVDLLAEKEGRFIRVQVKASRTYIEKDGELGGSWTQLRPDALTTTVCDYFVFVVYTPTEAGHRLKFAPYYHIISPHDLEKRLSKARTKPDRGVYWERHGDKLYETRSNPRLDFTEYLDKWCLNAGGLSTTPVGVETDPLGLIKHG